VTFSGILQSCETMVDTAFLADGADVQLLAFEGEGVLTIDGQSFPLTSLYMVRSPP